MKQLGSCACSVTAPRGFSLPNLIHRWTLAFAFVVSKKKKKNLENPCPLYHIVKKKASKGHLCLPGISCHIDVNPGFVCIKSFHSVAHPATHDGNYFINYWAHVLMSSGTDLCIHTAYNSILCHASHLWSCEAMTCLAPQQEGRRCADVALSRQRLHFPALAELGLTLLSEVEREWQAGKGDERSKGRTEVKEEDMVNEKFQ